MESAAADGAPASRAALPARALPARALPRAALGLGLRAPHLEHILGCWPQLDWFEAISENYMDSGGRPRALLERIARRYPISLHGVSLSIGSTDPLDADYLARLRRLADELQPVTVSDHLCWTSVAGFNSHDLLPLPLTEEALCHVARRVHAVQERLGRPLALENPSSYLRFRHSTLDEPEFLRELCARTGCELLLDINNIHVSCRNTGADPVRYLEGMPWGSVVQMHIAGHEDHGSHLIDTHGQPVAPEVWALYARAWGLGGGAPTLLERDSNIPGFEVCRAELRLAEQHRVRAARLEHDASLPVTQMVQA
ncbi:MAG TPA: DUF692 domain-containing protein [Polyangiaceae bacterium]|nr:DUF692 domain-containing protein [Polyangiaceae bacterium]